MNQRINELIKSTNYWYAETNSKADWRLLNGVGEMEWNQKFAELIAKEYIQNCRDMFVVGSVSWNLLNEKLEHFGVEE